MKTPAVLLVALLLAGCASKPQAPLQESSGPTAVVEASALQTLRYDGPAAINQTRWLNGSFNIQDTCNPIGCATGSAVRTLDVSDLLPPRVPVRFEAELRYTASALFGRALYLDLITDASSYTESRVRIDGLENISTTMMKGEGPVQLEVLFASPTGSGATVDYSLRVSVNGHVDWTPGGVPLLIDLGGPGTTVAVTPGPDRRLAANLIDPGDNFLGRLQGNGTHVTLDPGTGPPGAYVVVFPASLEAVQIRTNGTVAPLRALPLKNEFGPAHAVVGRDPIEWDFEVGRGPLFVGFYERPSNALVFQAGQSTVEIRSPVATVVQSPTGCGGLCLTSGFYFSVRSTTADPGVVSGGYHVRYEPTESADVEVGHWVGYYQR